MSAAPALQVGVVTRGLALRQAGLAEEGAALLERAAAAARELASFRSLAQRESISLPARLDAARGDVAHQQQREKDLQERFKSLQRERDMLQEALAAPVQAAA